MNKKENLPLSPVINNNNALQQNFNKNIKSFAATTNLHTQQPIPINDGRKDVPTPQQQVQSSPSLQTNRSKNILKTPNQKSTVAQHSPIVNNIQTSLIATHQKVPTITHSNIHQSPSLNENKLKMVIQPSNSSPQTATHSKTNKHRLVKGSPIQLQQTRKNTASPNAKTYDDLKTFLALNNLPSNVQILKTTSTGAHQTLKTAHAQNSPSKIQSKATSSNTTQNPSHRSPSLLSSPNVKKSTPITPNTKTAQQKVSSINKTTPSTVENRVKNVQPSSAGSTTMIQTVAAKIVQSSLNESIVNSISKNYVSTTKNTPNPKNTALNPKSSDPPNSQNTNVPMLKGTTPTAVQTAQTTASSTKNTTLLHKTQAKEPPQKPLTSMEQLAREFLSSPSRTDGNVKKHPQHETSDLMKVPEKQLASDINVKKNVPYGLQTSTTPISSSGNVDVSF